MKKYLAMGIVFILFVLTALFFAKVFFGGISNFAWMKMGLASGYLLAAVGLGAPGFRLGRWLLPGFCCAWWGDFFLIGPGNGFFLAGLVAFLLGHVCYCIAYATHGARWGVALISSAVLACPGAVLVWKLWPGIPAGLGAPVIVYLTVITMMVSLSFGCVGRPAGWFLVLGAVLFYLSDMGVSSQAFGGADMGPLKQLVKLYFPGQYVLAAAIFIARRSQEKGWTGAVGAQAGDGL